MARHGFNANIVCKWPDAVSLKASKADAGEQDAEDQAGQWKVAPVAYAGVPQVEPGALPRGSHAPDNFDKQPLHAEVCIFRLSPTVRLAKLDGGVERFAIITKREEGMSEEEYNMKVQEDSIKSRTNRMAESDFLARILSNMQRDKPWGKMD